MSFIEFIGFVISIAALFFLFIKRFLEDRRRAKNPEQFKEEPQERQALKEFLKSLEIDMEEDKKYSAHQPPKAPSQPPQPSSRQASKSSLPARQKELVVEKRKAKAGYEDKYRDAYQDTYTNTYEDRILSRRFQKQEKGSAYEIIEMDKATRVVNLLRGLKSPKDMILLNEIIGPPKGMQNLH